MSSGAPDADANPVDLSPENLAATTFRDLLARISRAQAKTDKFSAEQRRLSQEALKLGRDRKLAPVLVLTSILSGGVVAAVSWGLQRIATISAAARGTGHG